MENGKMRELKPEEMEKISGGAPGYAVNCPKCGNTMTVRMVNGLRRHICERCEAQKGESPVSNRL